MTVQGMIQYITGENFKKYGRGIEFLPEDAGNFKIIVKEPDYGWRIAVYKVEERAITELENHPESKESFEPHKGTVFLVVAPNQAPEDYEVFLLDKPVCLEKGVWHAVVAISEEAQVKITENIDVAIEFYKLKSEMVPVLV